LTEKSDGQLTGLLNSKDKPEKNFRSPVRVRAVDPFVGRIRAVRGSSSSQFELAEWLP
jgi:hypothetical protein